MLICVYTSVSPLDTELYEHGELIQDSASTHLDLAYGQSRWNGPYAKLFKIIQNY